MPVYKPEPASLLMQVVGYLIVFLFLVGLVVCFWDAPVIMIVAIAFVAVGSMITTWSTKKVLRKMAVSRKGEDIGTFARSFDCRTVDTWIIRAVYEELQPYLQCKEGVCPLRKTDRIFADLRVDDEEFSMDMIFVIAQRTNRSMENYEENPYFQKIDTVEDLVMFFNCQPLDASEKVGL